MEPCGRHCTRSAYSAESHVSSSSISARHEQMHNCRQRDSSGLSSKTCTTLFSLSFCNLAVPCLVLLRLLHPWLGVLSARGHASDACMVPQ